MILLQNLQQNNILLPASPRKITNERGVESFINRYWNEFEDQIRGVFQKFKLDIRKDEHGRKRIYAL